jgi:hypothetical protein
MSIRIMAQVWDIEGVDLDGSKLLLLLALADYANDNGVCWPSIPTLAKRARVGERQCMRLLQWLVDNGYIKVVERGTSRGVTNLYHVLPKDEPEKGDIQGAFDIKKGDIQGKRRVTSRDERVTSRAKKGDIAMSHQPLIEPPIEPSTEEPPTSYPLVTSSSERSEDEEVTAPNATRLLMLAYEEWVGYVPAAYGKESKAAKELLKRGYTIADVELAYRAIKQQPFWKSKHVSLMVVLEQIGALANYAKEGGDINQPAQRLSTPDHNRQAFEEYKRMLKEQGLWND